MELKYLEYLHKSLEQFYHNPAQGFWRSLECKLISEVKMQAPILDLGCGDGSFAKTVFSFPISDGIDLSEEDISRAAEKGIYERLTVGDARNLPYQSESFQTVFSNCVLEHIPDIEKVLSEVSRVLKPEGVFIFTVPSEKFGQGLFYYKALKIFHIKLAERYAVNKNKRLYHINCLSEDEWRQKLEKQGLKIDHAVPFMPYSAECLWDFLDEIFVLGFRKYRLYNGIILLSKIIGREKIVNCYKWFLNKAYLNSIKPDLPEEHGAFMIIAKKNYR